MITTVNFSSLMSNRVLAPMDPVDSQAARNPMVALPEDDFSRLEPEKLTSRRYPDWYVLTTMTKAFGAMQVNGTIPMSNMTILRDHLYKRQRFREARVAHQLIKYQKVLVGSGTPWEQERFKNLPGYSWADIQYLLGKVNAGQDIDDILTRHYDRQSREAMHMANIADIINVPLTLFAAFGGAALFSRLKLPRKVVG